MKPSRLATSRRIIIKAAAARVGRPSWEGEKGKKEEEEVPIKISRPMRGEIEYLP